jgi:hypothetical protein
MAIQPRNQRTEARSGPPGRGANEIAVRLCPLLIKTLQFLGIRNADRDKSVTCEAGAGPLLKSRAVFSCQFSLVGPNGLHIGHNRYIWTLRTRA